MSSTTARREACADWDSLRLLPAKPGPSTTRGLSDYTSNLLCVIWIGNDDYTDLKLEGAQAAVPCGRSS